MWSLLEKQPYTPPVICLEGAVSKSSMGEWIFLSDASSASSSAESLPTNDSTASCDESLASEADSGSAEV